MNRKIIRTLINVVISVFVLMVIVLLIFDQFVQFRMDDRDLKRIFAERHLTPYVGYYSIDGRRIRYLSIGQDTSCTILFIHGAPSSLSYWRNYLMDSTLLSRSRLYAVDRPGYGYSGLGDPEPDIQKQAQLLKPLLDSLHSLHRPLVLVGASYGTSVACRLIMDNPGEVDGLVLCGPSLGPGLEKTFWFTPIIESPLLRWFIPRMFQSANTEKLAHKQQLENMLPLWGNIRIPVIYMQGGKDELIYTTNAAFARQHLVNVPYLHVVLFPGKGHIISITEKDKVQDAILEMVHMATTGHIPPK
jgi:pimeloyl-ACP methyl ester carboxylesterase